LARAGEARFGSSGGDQIGRRRIDTHVLGLQALGATVDEGAELVLRARRLRGHDVLLDEASVTATENVLAAATLADGTTVIRNAASEPHVQDLCRLLIAMGARIEGVGSNVLVVHGVRALGGADVTLGADFMEVGSFLALAAVTGGEIEIRQASPEHMRIALIHGATRLRGEPQGIPSPDIRAGMALVIAALCADGRTVIRSVEQIDRGYEDIDTRLLALGARVKRVKV